MICITCGKQRGYSVLTKKTHGTVFKDIEWLEDICFICFESVPEHIPRKQIRKYLEIEFERKLKWYSV